jgi:hypothetical protein
MNDDWWLDYQNNWEPGMPIIGRPLENLPDDFRLIQQSLRFGRMGFEPSRVCEKCFAPNDNVETCQCVECPCRERKALKDLEFADSHAVVQAVARVLEAE